MVPSKRRRGLCDSAHSTDFEHFVATEVRGLTILEGCRGGSPGQGHNMQVPGLDIFAAEEHQ